MHRDRILQALAGLLLIAGAAEAAELTRINRIIAKEPAYEGKPRYCLLVFGPEAKTRVWLVQDGGVLHVDRNANGDLTDADERVKSKGTASENYVFEAGDIKDGALTHTKLVVTRSRAGEDYFNDAKEWDRVKRANPAPSIWTVSVTAERAAQNLTPQPPSPDRREGQGGEVIAGDGLPKTVTYIANGDGLGYLLFGDRPQDAPVIHFNGPWTLGLQDIHQRIAIGKPRDLQIGVGTQGIGPGTFSFVLYPGLIPNDAYPVADITFPAKSPGETPPQTRVVMKRRC